MGTMGRTPMGGTQMSFRALSESLRVDARFRLQLPQPPHGR